MMPQQPNLIGNLIALRDYYQGCMEEYERSTAHALEQLTHINALLVDHLAENQQAIANLMELRSHYFSLQEEHKRAAIHAKEQLLRAKAMLAEELLLQHQQPMSMEAATVSQGGDRLSLAAANLQRQGLPQLPEPLKFPDISEAQIFPTSGKMEQPEPHASYFLGTDSNLRFSATKTLMLPKYQEMTKTQAVEHLLREHEGTILHVEYIIRALYGELPTEAIKAEKPRIYDTLSRGVEKGLWDKVPDQASCYTIDLKLLESESVSPQTAQSSHTRLQPRQSARGRRSQEMLPQYQQFNFTEAVAAVVNEYAGQVLTTEQVAQALYGEVSGQALTKAKDRIGKTLWSGAKQDRWQRVPGQLGRYTLDLKLVSSKSPKAKT